MNTKESEMTNHHQTFSIQSFTIPYSQIELQEQAHPTQTSNLDNTLPVGKDIHSATAARMYNIPIDQVTPNMRRIAKALNFATAYGCDQEPNSQ